VYESGISCEMADVIPLGIVTIALLLDGHYVFGHCLGRAKRFWQRLRI
jgi:hypothetical protein